MKKIKQWANSRTRWQTAGWVALLFGCGALCFWQAVVGAVAYVVTLIVMLQMARAYKPVVTMALIGALLFSQMPAANTQPPPPPKQEMVPECNLWILGVVVLAIGVVVLYKLNQFCKAHFPPPNPPPPPPAPPGTNAPPDTNAPPPAPFPAVQMRANTTPTGYDISTNGWMDTSVTNMPVPFRDFVTFQLAGSTNLTDWTNCCTVNLWLSSNSVAAVIYDWQKVPVCTNWAHGNPYDAAATITNALAFPTWQRSQPKMFFRD